VPKEEEEKDSTGVNSELGMEKGLKIQEFYKIPNQLFPLLPQGAKPKYSHPSPLPPLSTPHSPFSVDIKKKKKKGLLSSSGGGECAVGLCR